MGCYGARCEMMTAMMSSLCGTRLGPLSAEAVHRGERPRRGSGRNVGQRRWMEQFVPAYHDIRQVQLFRVDLDDAHEDFLLDATVVAPHGYLFGGDHNSFRH